jgi:sugar phosphate isomerase/epimerase
MAETLDFKPEYMQVGMLTAALQELTPREIRDADPDRAIEDWVEYAPRIGINKIQLSSALHPSQADVPPEALMDPVANHLDLRNHFTAERAARVQRALKQQEVSISEVAYFDNMLHPDAIVRAKKKAFMREAMDAAVNLEVKAMCGFVGRNPRIDADQNLNMFEEEFIPVLQDAKDRGLTYRIEQCPMPGWNTTDTWENNLAYTPGTWIALHKIAEKHGVGDQFRITFDPSHAILMGQNPRDVFQFLKDKGYGFLIDAFHAKGQVIIPQAIAEWGYRGQTIERGDRIDGQPHPDPRQQGKAWAKMGFCEHELPGTARHDIIAYLQNRSVDWLDHQLAAREVLGLGEGTDFVVEHEYGPARIQDKEKLLPILQGSVAYIRAIDQAAANMYALHKVLGSQGIPVQGVGRRANRD